MNYREHFLTYTVSGRTLKRLRQLCCVHRWSDNGVQRNARRAWVCLSCERVVVREAGWVPFWQAIKLWRRGRGMPVRSSGCPWLLHYQDGSIEIDRTHPEGRRYIAEFEARALNSR